MSKLEVWRGPRGIVLAPATTVPNGAVWHPVDWKLLGTLEMTDAPPIPEDTVQEEGTLQGGA